jgi:hypothetical protein
VSQQPKLAAGSAFGAEDLYASEVSAQQFLCCIKDLFVQRLCPGDGDELGSNLLKELCVADFGREQLVAPPECSIGRFQFPDAFPSDLFRSHFHVR